MRSAVASLFLFAVAAIGLFGDNSRNMFAPAMTSSKMSVVPAMTSGQMAATPIYSPAVAPFESMQYVQQAYVQSSAYAQPVDSAAQESSWAWAYAAAGALLLGATAAARSQPASVAEADLEAASSAAHVATLAVAGRKPPAPKKNALSTNKTAQQRLAEKALNNPMNFDGWLPETVNGRLAQVGFIAAIAGEITTKQTLAEQFQSNFDGFAVTAILVMLGSLAPSIQRTLTADYDESGERVQEEAAKNKLLAFFKVKRETPKPAPAKYTSDPKSISLSEDPFGIFKYNSEVFNNRGAMLGIAAMLATEYITKQPIFMLAVNGEDVSADKKDKAESRPGLKGVEAMERTRENPMNFNGWAPEVINGRLAQPGFVSAIAGEISTGQTLAEQFQNNFTAFGASVLLVTVASFAPSVQQAITQDLSDSKSVGYASDPKTIAPSEDPFGVFKESSELANS